MVFIYSTIPPTFECMAVGQSFAEILVHNELIKFYPRHCIILLEIQPVRNSMRPPIIWFDLLDA